ncbi:MAG: Nuclease SbcCD subunit C [Syntrophus sp. PtaB.Bin001]|nr:MAG: Nuclease SbcCD subunit C [Syntrophus sp. PtaB.Bin001]
MTADALIGLESGHARTTTEIRLTENDLAEKEKELATSEKQCTELLLKLGMEVPEPERAEKIAKELADVRMKLAETVKIVASTEKKEKQEKSLQTAMEKVRRAFDHADNALQDARHNLEKTVLDQERLDKECDILEEEVKKARAAALADVEPFGFKELPSENLDILLNDLKRHKDLWLIKVAEKTGQEKKIDELKAGVEKHEALRCSLDEDLAALRKDLDQLKRDQASLIDFRRTLFGEKNADEEEKRLTEEIDKAGKVFEKAREDHGKIEREISALKERIASLQAGTDRRAEELMQAERHWEQRIQEAVFTDEADFLSSRLSEEERKRLGEKEQALLKEKTELDARRKDRLENLATERKRTPTDQSAEVLKELIRTGETELKQLRLDIGGMVKSLSDNENRRKNQQERLKNIDLQKRECARWDDLHQLIGSADGKKFRNFAQGLTFEMMIVYANSRLREMTDRYLLIHNEAQPLELNIIDNYQAGEIRSTKNLSGGESFIVSLALALGLSQMASRNVRVDSLFLDEGFGTLDEDALETALETLAGLRQDGKLIGVISHVAALKERIGTQIQVTPGTGGRSTLSGPGCRRI